MGEWENVGDWRADMKLWRSVLRFEMATCKATRASIPLGGAIASIAREALI